MAIYLAARFLVQPIFCLLNISLCFSVSKAHLAVYVSSLLGQLPVSLSNPGNDLFCLIEKVHLIQQMYLFKTFTLPYKDVSSFAMEAEQKNEKIRHVEGQDSSVSGSVIDCGSLGCSANSLSLSLLSINRTTSGTYVTKLV